MPANLSSYSTRDIPDLLKDLNTADLGLTEHEARIRISKIGPNSLVKKNTKSPVIEFLNNFLDPLVITLIVIAIISFALDNSVDGILIMVMVMMSVILNFIQEHKASKAASTLLSKVAHVVDVYRNSRLIELPAHKLVPGDVIELNAGDLIPADARIIESKDLYVNQSALTGESFPVAKSDAPSCISPKDLTDLTTIALAGTGVYTGWAKAVVVATGMQTEYGKLAQAVNEATEVDEFSSALNQFSSMIIKLIASLVIFIFGFRAAIYHDIWSSLQFAVAVAVGLTPEFLPMIMSVTMGKGSVRMAKKGVIVKKLTAIPTLGSMDVLCTDKTGTLTENKIAVVKYVDLFGNESEETLTFAYLNSHFQSGITNPMDDAIQDYKHLSSKGYEKLDEIPFDFERKKLSVVVERHNTPIMITKGAPEAMVEAVNTYWHQQTLYRFTAETKQRYLDLYHQLSQDGFRVLAVATKTFDAGTLPKGKEDEKQMSLAGFIAFLDPPKKGVRKALDELERLGIRLKVITGDNELVAAKICDEVDVPIEGIMLGEEVDALSDHQLAKRAETTTIFARVAPAQKNRVIKALRSNDHVVGYMGDGINDAPSLISSDVGISVSNAVEVAREAADMVLTHKSLHDLAQGVIEGRKTFGNTMKYIMMGLSSNFGNMFSMIGAVIFLPFLPMLPLQILLNNFLYDFTQITIPTDSVDESYIEQPKRLRIQDIQKFMFIFGPLSSLFDFFTFGVLYVLFAHSPAQFQTGWFMESLATQTLVIHVIRTRLVPFVQSKASTMLMITTFGGVLVGWLLPLTPLGHLFGLQPIGFMPSLILVVIIVVYLFCVELAKQWYYKKSLLMHERQVYALLNKRW